MWGFQLGYSCARRGERKKAGKGKKVERNWNGDPSGLQEEENRGNQDVSEKPVPSAESVV